MGSLPRSAIAAQFGAALDMLENAMNDCPDHLWNDRTQKPEFWYLIFHTLFWLDLYLSPSLDGFAPPAPFTLDELDPEGKYPEEPYSKEQMRDYFRHGRAKLSRVIEDLTDDEVLKPSGFDWVPCNRGELLLYNLRHVQHGAGQLNLILRQRTGSAPRWVKRSSVT